MKTIKRTLKGLLITGLAIICMTGCKKYDEGPAISLRSKTKRVVNLWKLDKYYWNGTEATSSLLISGYTEEYTKSGSYTRSYVDKDGDFFSETGNWEFDDKKDNLVIKSVSSIELTNNNSTVTNTNSTILKLKENEMWYSFENGGDLHEFRFVTK
ncbi:MAG: hypothetical protein FVQ77_11275 [Cytophagales bacterium]|nr:hypothetical protein [Cytophagales bacterium]